MYSVEFTPSAAKQFEKLDMETQTRIAAALERCRIRPHAFAVRLVGSSYYRIRAGNFRAIIDIKDAVRILFVLKVGHRENIYS